MAKRDDIDLMALTARAATPMPETERLVKQRPAKLVKTLPVESRPAGVRKESHVPTAELVNLSFKVPPAFRRRFRDVAHNADLKQNLLLFAALEAWVKANAN